MKKLLTILFLFYAVLSFGQTSVKYRQATLDTLRLKDLPALPSVVANFTAVVAYNDSLWFQDKNGTLYNILNWLDSIAAHRIELDAHLDSLIRHTENYYSLRDSVGDNIDSIAQHRVEIDANTESIAQLSIEVDGKQDIRRILGTAAYADISQFLPAGRNLTKEIASDGENNIPVGFTLTASVKVYYNGYPLPTTRWTGLGTSVITLNVNTRKYDELIINN